MDNKTLSERKQNNLGWLLFVLSAVFWVTNRYRGQNIAMAGYAFTSVIAFPGLFALLGQEAKRWAKERECLVADGAGMILLGYAQKVLLYWVETLSGRTPAFHPFSTSGAPWFFLVGGVYLLLAGTVRRQALTSRWLLPAAAVIGLGVGALKHVGDDLCLSRIAVYLPFFVLGFQLDLEKIFAWGRSLRNQLLSLAAVGGWAVFCLLLRSRWSSLRGLLDGNKWYGGIDGIARVRMGPFYRLAFYVGAAVLLLALCCLIPAWKVRLLSDGGKRWKSGYFWFSVTVLALTAPMGDKLTLTGAAVTGALCLAAVLIYPTRLMAWLPEAIFTLPERLRHDRPETEAPPDALGHKSFFQKHRWGLGLTALYTGCFLVAVMGFVFPFFSNGRSLVWQMDGLSQQYPLLPYTKRYLIESFQHLIQTGELRFPEWDFTLGFGLPVSDNIRREPFQLLSLLATEDNLETLFNVTTVLRMYVCGLSFLWYCTELGKRERVPIVMGALVCVFAGFSILAAIRQPSFVTTLLTYFVLMLVAIERYLKGKSPAMFVGIVFLQYFNSYYATYINSLLMAIYLLLRLWGIYGRDVKAIAVRIVKLIGYYVWGMMMGMTVLLPTIVSFLSSGRSEDPVRVTAFYGKSYYTKLLTGLNLEAGGAGYRTFVSFASIALLATVLLFLKRRKELRPLKIAVCTAAVFISMPAFGWIFNGFGYVTNRWCFVIGFLMGLVVVELAPELLRLTRRERVGLAVFAVAYCAIVVANEDGLTRVRYLGLVMLGITALVVLMLREVIPGRRLQMAALALLTLANVTFSSAAAILPNFGDYASDNVALGEVDETLALSMRAGLGAIDDDSFYRIARPNGRTNQSQMLDYYGASTYYSILDADVSRFFVDVGLNTQYQTFCVGGLDERAALTELASVKYYVTDRTSIYPYGFELMDTVTDEDGDTEAYVYRNPYALPLGYTYTSFISQVAYDKMTPLERQQVMLDHVVWDGNDTYLEQGEQVFYQERIPCKVASTSDLELDEAAKSITTGSSAGSLTLDFEGKPNCETYLVIEGLRDTAGGSSSSKVKASVSGLTKESALYSKARNYYFTRDTVTYNFGYTEQARNRCYLRFAPDLNVEYDDIYVVCVPMDRYAEQASRLGEVVLENVTEDYDRITGTITVEQPRMLVFTIHNVPGWTAYVNGEERALEVVNEIYYGLLLDEGSYDIELVFHQPGQTAGNLISAVAIAAAVPALVLSRLRRRKERRAEQINLNK